MNRLKAYLAAAFWAALAIAGTITLVTGQADRPIVVSVLTVFFAAAAPVAASEWVVER